MNFTVCKSFEQCAKLLYNFGIKNLCKHGNWRIGFPILTLVSERVCGRARVRSFSHLRHSFLRFEIYMLCFFTVKRFNLFIELCFSFINQLLCWKNGLLRWANICDVFFFTPAALLCRRYLSTPLFPSTKFKLFIEYRTFWVNHVKSGWWRAGLT